MTSGPRSQCDACARFRSPLQRADDDWDGPAFCEAFPEADGGIPGVIFRNGMDHRQPIEGDHGLRWTPADGEEFPISAFLPQFLDRGGTLPAKTR